MRLSISLLALLAGVSLISACSVLPQQQPPAKTYDLGPLPTGEAFTNLQFPANVTIGSVDATPWLQSRSIYYRFGYLDAARLRNYTRSSWLAPPAVLLRERLSDAMAQSGGDIGASAEERTLNLHLQRFEQVFSAPHKAHVLAEIRASLTSQSEDRTLAQKVFRFSQKAQSADATGAVNAYRDLSGQFLKSLARWLSRVDSG